MNTYESCPDLAKVQEAAREFAVRRFGKLPVEMSESMAREYVTKGWGFPVSKARSATAIGAGFWKFAAERTISVNYTMPAGRSAGGFDRGATTRRYSTYTTKSIEDWAWTNLAWT